MSHDIQQPGSSRSGSESRDSTLQVAEHESDVNSNSLGHKEEQIQEEPDKLEKEQMVFDKGYCWVICLSCFLLNFCTWGMNSGFAIFFSVYLNNGTFANATKVDYAAIGGLAFGTTLIFAPFINYLQGAIGVRTTIIVGNCFQFTSLMLASWCTKLWQLYLTQGLMQSVGLALISLPGLTILPQFFKEKRVLAGGIATAGSGAGGIVFNLGMQKIVEVRTVFWALRAQSIISFGLVWIAIALFKTRSKQHEIQFTFFDKQVASSFGFWLACLYVITCMFGYVVVLYTLANFTTSLGYSEHQGSIASAMIQAGSVLGRPLVGLLADKYGATTLAFESYLLSAIFTLAMWIPTRNFATVVAYGVIIGAIMGTIWGTIAPLLARLVGIRKMNVTFSMLWTLLGMSGVASPVIGVSLVRGEGGEPEPNQYVDCCIFAGVAFAVCALSLFLLRGYILARDVIMFNAQEHQEHKVSVSDHDLLDPVSVRVPFKEVIKHVFRFKGVQV